MTRTLLICITQIPELGTITLGTTLLTVRRNRPGNLLRPLSSAFQVLLRVMMPVAQARRRIQSLPLFVYKQCGGHDRAMSTVRRNNHRIPESTLIHMLKSRRNAFASSC